jgi:hypothetical protein
VQPRPNLIQDRSGSSIEFHGRAGLRVTYDGHSYTVSSEMLAEPMAIAVYPTSLHVPDGVDSTSVLSFVRDGLEWAGYRVVTIP